MKIEDLESVLKVLIERCEKDLQKEVSDHYTSYMQGKNSAYELILETIIENKEGR